MPNMSTGNFVAQVTVAVRELTGLVLGTSAGGLNYFQSSPSGNSDRTRFLGASPDATVHGYQVFVTDRAGTTFGAKAPFPNISRIDVQIEQTDTDLIFRARPTPATPGPGGWTVVYTENTAVNAQPVQLGAGISDASKGGSFYFTGFAADGEGLGGEAEHAIIVALRDSAEALRSAEAKISAGTPDLLGALADVDQAIDARAQAEKLLDLSSVDGTLQAPIGAVRAHKTLDSLIQPLATARTAIATADPKKAKPEVAKLESFAVSEEGVMASLLGWKMPPKLSKGLFSLRVP